MNGISKTMSATLISFAALLPVSNAHSQQILEGDMRLACEALLCLASATRPAECSASLQRYFSIRHKKFSDTINARNGFLKLCPVSQQTPQMSALVNSLTHGAGRCDANSLNATLRQSSVGDSGQPVISNQMPGHCTAYFQHEYTNFRNSNAIPKYVGIPERGGFWVEAANFDQAQTQYRNRIAAEDQARRQAVMQGG